jgi:hypothetical protein
VKLDGLVLMSNSAFGLWFWLGRNAQSFDLNVDREG